MCPFYNFLQLIFPKQSESQPKKSVAFEDDQVIAKKEEDENTSGENSSLTETKTMHKHLKKKVRIMKCSRTKNHNVHNMFF